MCIENCHAPRRAEPLAVSGRTTSTSIPENSTRSGRQSAPRIVPQNPEKAPPQAQRIENGAWIVALEPRASKLFKGQAQIIGLDHDAWKSFRMTNAADFQTGSWTTVKRDAGSPEYKGHVKGRFVSAA